MFNYRDLCINNIVKRRCTRPNGSYYYVNEYQDTYSVIQSTSTHKCKYGSRQFQPMLISESGCCTTNVKLTNSAEPCERRPKVASHRSLSCLLTVKLFISRSSTRVNNNTPVYYDRKYKDNNYFIPHRRFTSLRSFC